MINEINSTELQDQLVSGNTIHLYDIRSAVEVSRGILPNAEHLPMHLIPLKINELPKEQKFVLYCQSGARSFQACQYLMQQGYDNVLNLRGGIVDWARNGFNIVAHTP